jgi:hypothetical protein
MALEFPVSGKARATDEADNCRGIGSQTLGERADAEERVFSGKLEYGTDDLLAPGAKRFDTFWKRYDPVLRRIRFKWHNGCE